MSKIKTIAWSVYGRLAWDKNKNLGLQTSLLSVINATISEYFSKNTLKIIDLGCGTGDYAYALSKNGHKVVALDSAKGMIKKAKEKYGNETNLDFVLSDLNFNLPVNNETFNLGICFSVLQTVRDPVFTLIEAHRVLSKNAYFIITHHRKSIQRSNKQILNVLQRPTLSKFLYAIKKNVERLAIFNKYWSDEVLYDFLHLSGFNVLKTYQINGCLVIVSNKVDVRILT